jgi:hypothetical protein
MGSYGVSRSCGKSIVVICRWRAAAQLLGRSERQVWRWLKEFRAAGAAGLVSKKRGRPSNRRTAASVRAAALWIVRQYYADFGPTPVQARGRLLAAEKPPSTAFRSPARRLRRWMIADGLWRDRKQRKSVRERYSDFGPSLAAEKLCADID